MKIEVESFAQSLSDRARDDGSRRAQTRSRKKHKHEARADEGNVLATEQRLADELTRNDETLGAAPPYENGVFSSETGDEDEVSSVGHELLPKGPPLGATESPSARRRAAKKRKKASKYAKFWSLFEKVKPYSLSSLAILGAACLIGLFLILTRSASTGEPSTGDGGQVESPVVAIAQIQDQFESVLKRSGSGLIMKWDMTKAELAIEDLKAVVEESDLKCRDRLTPVLSEYVTNSAKVAKQLPQLDTALVGAVTHMLATNKYAVQTLGEIKQSSSSLSESALSMLWGGRMTEQKFLPIFMNLCADMIQEVEDLLRKTMRLEDDLDRQTLLLRTTRQIISSDERENKILYEDTLGQRWTKVGGNKEKVANFKNNKELLDRAQEYSEVALKHVVWTLGQLEQIEALSKDLMAKMKRWPLKKDVPIQHHVDVLVSSMARLAQVRDAAQQNKDAGADYVSNGPKHPSISATKTD